MKSGSIIIVIVQRTFFFDIIESQCSDIFETLNVFFGYNFKYLYNICFLINEIKSITHSACSYRYVATRIYPARHFVLKVHCNIANMNSC